MRTFRTLLALVATVVLAAGCTASTESTEVGVMTAKWHPLHGRGVQEEIQPPGGTYFMVRPAWDWHVYDIGLQNLEMLRERGEGARRGDDSLRFKTVDGNDVSVNVTIAWTIAPERSPYLLRFVGSSTNEVEEKLVRPVSRTMVRDVLNQLTSEMYYQADKRFAMAEEAKRRLNVVLAEEGILIENVLLGEHKFNATYEQTIRDKKVAEQEGARLISETRAAREEMTRDLERAKGTVGQQIEQALGEASKRKLEADAIYFERQRQAEAILTEKRALAEGLTERARAMSGAGGEAMVKLKVAEALRGKKIIFIPAGSGMDLRNTDVNDLLKIYGAKSLSE
jgi:regulator of protease activity HflC (stomatin/prohibitin superfamily)